MAVFIGFGVAWVVGRDVFVGVASGIGVSVGVSNDVEIGVSVDKVAVGVSAGDASEGVPLHATNSKQHSITRMSNAVALDHLNAILIKSFIRL